MTNKEEQRRIASNIRKMREIRGYDQDYMAKQLGIKQNTYSRIETGEIKLTAERLEKIADVFSTTIEAIKSADFERMVFHIQHKEGYSGNISIYNAVGETLREFERMFGKIFEKALEKYAQPYKDQIERLEDEVRFLRKLVEDNKK